ncbi:Alpha/Beta hydrolase protein [Aspergillus unguis]
MSAQYAPAWQQFLDEFGESPALRGSLPDLKSQWQVLLKKLARYSIPTPDESVKAEDITIDDFWVRVYTPPESTAGRPVGIYIHGGGYAMGSVDEEDAVCRLISKTQKITVVSVGYKLAPESKYPGPLDDCVKATIWAHSTFHVSAILIGASAGGNLALGVALKMIDQGRGDSIKGVVALVPITIHPDAVPADLQPRYTAYKENADATVNTASAMRTFLDAYGAPPDDIYTSVLLHPKLNQLKKVYLAECGADTLRDDARLLKEELDKAGVPTKYDAYPGFPHYSWTFPSPILDQHREEFLGKVLGGVAWVSCNS